MTYAPIALAASLAACLAMPAIAAGGGGGAPSTTPTTTKCKAGQVYDTKTRKCVQSSSSLIDDDQRYGAIRELAYAGQYDRALMVLASADNPGDPRMLNYRGFIARKQGDLGTAMGYYKQALAADPDYLLARSYMGQGLIAQGDFAGALRQLREIEARGGKDTWAHEALELALLDIPTDY